MTRKSNKSFRFQDRRGAIKMPLQLCLWVIGICSRNFIVKFFQPALKITPQRGKYRLKIQTAEQKVKWPQYSDPA